MAEVDKLLIKGLKSGYAGGTEVQTVKRGSIILKSSEYKSPDGGYYIDEWVNGGGQELAVIDREGKTRVYAGRTISDEELAKLNLTESDVTSYLILKVGELGENTRLGDNCVPEPDGDWQYEYTILKYLDDTGLIISLEEICYKGIRVFAHGFAQSPAKIKIKP